MNKRNVDFLEIPEFIGQERGAITLNGRIEQIAFEAEGKYIAVQETEGGYDYTIYNKDFQGLDGGVYDNPDRSIWEILKDILLEEGLSIRNCRIIDYEELMEKTEKVGQEEIQRILLIVNGINTGQVYL